MNDSALAQRIEALEKQLTQLQWDVHSQLGWRLRDRTYYNDLTGLDYVHTDCFYPEVSAFDRLEKIEEHLGIKIIRTREKIVIETKDKA